MNVGDKVKVDTVINGWLDGMIVAKIEVLGYPTTYNVRINLGKFGEVIEPVREERLKYERDTNRP